MVPAPPPVPTRFPCWVRAVYSWGGENKRDLGFIEGDLIECLNAGDGSWWTGRLWRDRRAIGVFPSNFVELMPENFRPTSRSTSPMASSNSPSPSGTPQKSRTFRKPFEAYSKAPHYTTAKVPETYKDGSVSRPPRAGSIRPRSRGPIGHPGGREGGHGYGYPHGGPHPPSHGGRAPSPAPFRAASPNPYRAPSPAPYPVPIPPPLAGSPAPTGPFRAASPSPYREASPAPYRPRASSPAPYVPSPAPYHPHSHSPSPAPLRNTSPSRSRSPYKHQLDYRGTPPIRDASPARAYSPMRAHSPAPPSPAPSYRPYRPPQLQDGQYQEGGPGGGDSPPPPPPPHRNPVSRHGSKNSYNGDQHSQYQPQYYEDIPRPNSTAPYNQSSNGYPMARTPSPCPPSPAASGAMTPSPLREAMDDVMEQLDVLSGGGKLPRDGSPEPLDPWAPEAFEEIHQKSRKARDKRPQSTLLIDEGYETYSGTGSSLVGPTSKPPQPQDEPSRLPQLSNYVERMESRLRTMHQHSASMNNITEGPPPPPKSPFMNRPKSSIESRVAADPRLRKKKSSYDMGRQTLDRSSTTKTTSTNASDAPSNVTYSSTTTDSTNRSLMSGVSAGGISATSAGSLARKNRIRAHSALSIREESDRPETPFTGITYHSSHASENVHMQPKSRTDLGQEDSMGNLGGLVTPKPKKQNFIKRILESAKTGVANSRNSIASAGSSSPTKSATNPLSALSGGPSLLPAKNIGREGMGSGVDWVQVRRDVNRSNSLSQNERTERKERCQMLDHPALNPVEELYNSIDGDEGADGMPVQEPFNYLTINLSQVDKNSRFVASLPPTTTAASLAATYVCRPYHSDVQRLRAIFTWVSEKVCWEEDFEGPIDTRRVIHSKRGCSEEFAVLVAEMCEAVGLHCEVVRGYLKSPGEIPDANIVPRPNHWWNAVIVDNEWRMMDTCLASPSFPRRALYSSWNSSQADPWWFLARPTEICWTHIPEHHEQQHICPPVAHEVLLNLPCACPPYFKHGLDMFDYNTSLIRIEDLEMVHIKFNVPADVEIAAEVETRALTKDNDGDVFESGEVVKKRALAQAEWFGGVKRYTVKALLPGDEGTGTLKIYAGKRGLMHSIKDIPHPLAFALPIIHTGENPPYEFVTRHPTPHAQRHDLYIVQPQCQRLALNNTFVFIIRQHPSSSSTSDGPMSPSITSGSASPIPFHRPSSAMSMTSSAAGGSQPSTTAGGSGNSSSSSSKKPAKLAIQTPGGKILRLMRKEDRGNGRGTGIGFGSRAAAQAAAEPGEEGDGGTWETIIKCSERGTWRGLVLADRTARWCVFAEWVCQ
ncbi:hypothetical protein B0T13DRAFT_449875 [Neurospora crassa]|nr:hypothetical protein B0T13DRAFT_449875 [Neurospora crassa]